MQSIIDTIHNDFRKRSQNKGVRIIKQWEPSDEELMELVQDCVYFIQFHFHKITAEFDAGFCSLTSVLMGCGEEVRRRIDFDDDGTPEHKDLVISCGAVIIHNLAVNNFIAVERSDKSKRAKWHVQALDKWLTLGEAMTSRISREFNYLTFNKPLNIATHKHPHNRRRVIKNSSPEQFDALLGTDHLSGMDKLQQTSLRVNREVFGAVSSYKWDNSIPEIPTEGSKPLVDILYNRLKKDPSVQEEYNDAAAKWEAKRKILKDRSNVMERVMTISKATNLLFKEQFHCLMEFDYRGRMYYGEPYFHYQGNDIMKGLIEFVEAKPVTERGMFWLKAQAATCYNKDFTKAELATLTWTELNYVERLEAQGLDDLSLDKMSLKDRVEWVNRSIGLIIDTAKSKKIPMNADEPVLFLATCIEIYKTLQAEKDGVVHHSHLPVAVDGSQNVLQHVSAINLDHETGEKVGLTERPCPFDIYLAVGKRIIGHAPEFFGKRDMSMKAVRKNISKRSTMVRNYSAGRQSISSNMYRDCVKNGASDKYDITPTDCFMLAGLAMKAIDEEVPANKTFRKFLQKLVKYEIGSHDYKHEDGTDAFQDWRKLFASYNTMSKKDREVFTGITRTLTTGLNKNTVSWTTPTGFPVVQKINYQVTLPLRPSIQGHQKNLQIKFDSQLPNLEKHLSAIAANFVHSQDSSHAALVINRVSTDSFLLIHDSFAVHASDVDELVKVSKDTFKEIYSTEQNYYQLIQDQLLSDSSEFEVDLPELGTLNLDDLDGSDYFFC